MHARIEFFKKSILKKWGKFCKSKIMLFLFKALKKCLFLLLLFLFTNESLKLTHPTILLKFCPTEGEKWFFQLLPTIKIAFEKTVSYEEKNKNI